MYKIKKIIPRTAGYTNRVSFYNPRFLIAESYGISNEIRNEYYESGAVPFNFALIQYLNDSCNAMCMKTVISDSLSGLKDNYWPNFVVGIC